MKDEKTLKISFIGNINKSDVIKMSPITTTKMTGVTKKPPSSVFISNTGYDMMATKSFLEAWAYIMIIVVCFTILITLIICSLFLFVKKRRQQLENEQERRVRRQSREDVEQQKHLNCHKKLIKPVNSLLKTSVNNNGNKIFEDEFDVNQESTTTSALLSLSGNQDTSSTVSGILGCLSIFNRNKSKRFGNIGNCDDEILNNKIRTSSVVVVNEASRRCNSSNKDCVKLKSKKENTMRAKQENNGNAKNRNSNVQEAAASAATAASLRRNDLDTNYNLIYHNQQLSTSSQFPFLNQGKNEQTPLQSQQQFNKSSFSSSSSSSSSLSSSLSPFHKKKGNNKSKSNITNNKHLSMNSGKNDLKGEENRKRKTRKNITRINKKNGEKFQMNNDFRDEYDEDSDKMDDRTSSNSVIRFFLDRLRLDMWLRRPDEIIPTTTAEATDRVNKLKSLDIKRPFGNYFFYLNNEVLC